MAVKNQLLDGIITRLEKSKSRAKGYRRQFSKTGAARTIARLEKELQKPSVDLDLVRCFIDLIQLSNDPASYSKYPLKEIAAFQKALCKLFPHDIDLNREYYYFLFNVMDAEKQAARHWEGFSKQMSSQLKIKNGNA
jgi:hypothetical protein